MIFLMVRAMMFGMIFLITNLGCSNTKTASCNTSDTPATVSAAEITSPPAGVQSFYKTLYTPTKYLPVTVGSVKMHVLGSSSVSDWMMVNTHELIRNIIGSLSSRSDREKFNNFQVYVITDSDPAIDNGVAGQRNTGNKNYAVINEVLVCASAVDTIRPTLAPVYRAWDTPIHEIGHSVQETLELNDLMAKIESEKNPWWNSSTANEYFPWANEKWFNATIGGKCGIEAVESYEKTIFSAIYSNSNVWRPTCAGRP